MASSTAKDFSKRLNQACDNLDTVPEHGQGRQVYIARRMNLTQEAVRKWFAGESVPRTAKMRKLASILDVDEAWLALGITPTVERREKRALGDKTDGAVYVAYGLMTMMGGHCAFPRSNDPRSEYVDFYAIMGGVQQAVHVCVGREISKGEYCFDVPLEYADVTCLGVVHAGGLRLHMLNLTAELIDRNKHRKGPHFEIRIARQNSDYWTEKDHVPRIHSITDLAA